MRERDRARSALRATRRYETSSHFGGWHLTREAILAVGTHPWVLGDRRRYDAGPSTPNLDTQRITDFRFNPTQTFGGWVRAPYKVSRRY